MVKAMAAPMATRMAMTIPAIAPSERPVSNVPSAVKTSKICDLFKQIQI